MTVENQFPYQSFTANGSQTNFVLGFYVDDKDHFQVKKNDQVVSNNSYTYDKNSNAIVLDPFPEQGDLIEITRTTVADRSVTYATYNNSFRPEVLNTDIDRVWLKIQELGVADVLIKIYTDKLHLEQKNYIDSKDQVIHQIITDLKTYVNQQDSSLSSSINNLRNYVDTQDSNQNNYFTDQIQKQGVSLQQLNDYYNHLMQRIAAIAVNKGWEASLVVDKNGRTQQQINDDVINAVSRGVKNDGVTDVKTAFTTLANSMNDGETLYLPKGTYYWDATTGTANINKNISIKGEGAVIKVKGYNGYTPFISFNCTEVTTFAASDVLNSLNKNTTRLDIKGTPIQNP